LRAARFGGDVDHELRRFRQAPRNAAVLHQLARVAEDMCLVGPAVAGGQARTAEHEKAQHAVRPVEFTALADRIAVHPVAIGQAVVLGEKGDQVVRHQPALAKVGELFFAHAHQVVDQGKQSRNRAIAVEFLAEPDHDVVERLVADHLVVVKVELVGGRDGAHGFLSPIPINSSVKPSRSFIMMGNFEVQSLPS
jgi:hypothetical protein